MKMIGILVVGVKDSEEGKYGVINPEHPYIVLNPEECPDDALPVISSIVEQGEYMPIGVVVDPEVDLEP